MNIVATNQPATPDGWAAEYDDGTKRPLVTLAMRDGYVFGIVVGNKGTFVSAEALPGFRRFVQDGGQS